jgi:hypothetical protein
MNVPAEVVTVLLCWCEPSTFLWPRRDAGLRDATCQSDIEISMSPTNPAPVGSTFSTTVKLGGSLRVVSFLFPIDAGTRLEASARRRIIS